MPNRLQTALGTLDLLNEFIQKSQSDVEKISTRSFLTFLDNLIEKERATIQR